MLKARTIILIVPVVLLAVALAGGSSLMLRLFFVSVLVPLAGYLWTVFGIRGVGVRAEEPPEHCQVGEQFQQAISVYNNSRIPKLWLKLEANTDMPGSDGATFVNLPRKSYYQWDTSVFCQRRGRYDVGSVVATAADPFGLFSRQRKLGKPQSVLVYPPTFDLPLFKLSSSSDLGRGSGYQSLSQISPNASSVREFITGDSLRHIHWQSTAHTGRLMVKVFDADRSYGGTKTLWVVMDMQGTHHAGQDIETTEEYGIAIGASLIRKYVESGMRVGMLAQGDQSCIFPPERGEEHLWRILEALALVRATGQVPIAELLYDKMGQFRDNPAVIIITPSATGQLIDVIRHLRGRVESIVVVLLDAASFGGYTTAMDISRNLTMAGVKVYTVRQGDELARVLDDRHSPMRTRAI
jgi:uncharacterized protein (DUF58 family)